MVSRPGPRPGADFLLYPSCFRQRQRRHDAGRESIFIEWTAAEAEPEVAAELVDIQVMLALWRRAWPEAKDNQLQRSLLSIQAKKWADQVLGYAGLV